MIGRDSGVRHQIQEIDCISPRMISVYVFVACMLVFLVTQVDVVGGDSPGIAYLPVALLREGTLRLDGFINQNPFFDLERSPHYIVESQGHYYSKFSPIPSLLSVPLYALGLTSTSGMVKDIATEAFLYVTLSRIAAAMIASIITVVVFLIARLIVRQSVAALLSLAYALSTFTWASATNTLASQSSGELFTALSVLILLSLQRDMDGWKRRALSFCCGLCVALAVASRPQLLPTAVIVSVYVLVGLRLDKLRVGAYAAGALIVAGLWMAYNAWAFGSPLLTGYQEEALSGWSTPLWVGLPAMLFSPSHGLLMYSPVLVIGTILGTWVVFARSPVADMLSGSAPWGKTRLLGRAALVVVIVQMLMMSHWWAWHGGVAYNQRMLQEVHPLMMLLTAMGVRTYGRRRGVVGLLVIGGGWGGFLNVCRVAFYDQHLTWLETFHPELTWSWKDIEPLFYLGSHGAREFVSGLLLVLLKVFAVLALILLLLWLRSAPGAIRRGLRPPTNGLSFQSKDAYHTIPDLQR